MTRTRAASWMPDTLAALALFAVVVGYLAVLPLNLQSPDEARHLDHAKRLLDGEVLYRDIFDITTPGWVFLMTGAFAAFGTTLSVARGVAAVIHGATAIAMFAICRQLGVRRGLAWACAFAAVLITQRLCAGATYHWLSTFLCIVVLLLLLAPTRAVSWAFVTGIVVGLLVAVHQQRGAVFATGTAVWLAVQWGLDRLHGTPRGWKALWHQLLGLAGGVAAVMVPLLIGLAAWAGIGPVWQCLISTPLLNYHPAQPVGWGHTWGGDNARITVALYAPFALVLSAGMAVALAWRRDAPAAARQFALVTVIGAAALLSMAYLPDIVHLGLVAPLFLIALTAVVEQALRALPASIDRPLGTAAAAAVVLAVAIGAYRTAVDLRANFRIPYQTAFGRIDLGTTMAGVDIGQYQVEYYDQLRALVDSTPGRVLYVHPRAIYTNLLLDARNPTRFDLVWAPLYTPPDQQQEVIAALRDQRVPYIVWSPVTARARAEDLVTQFILENYEQASEPQPLAASLWKLKAVPGDGNKAD